jgi:signal transduction histidine kinase
MIAAGGVASGVGALLLMPVVGVALYGRRWESAGMVGAVMGALVGVTISTGSGPVGTDIRRTLLFGSLSLMISVAIQTLRARLEQSNQRTANLLHQSETINAAAVRLATLLDPAAIVANGVELVAHIASPCRPERWCVSYCRVFDDSIVIDRQFCAPGSNLELNWTLDDDPIMKSVAVNGEPVLCEINLNEVAPHVRAALEDLGITHGAWIPVRPGGTLDGVLTIFGRGEPLSEERFMTCIALGHMMELALSNWAAHQRLEHEATAEERRRIARDLHDGLAHELAFIASRSRRPPGLAFNADTNAELAAAADRALDEARRAITVLSATKPLRLQRGLAQTAEDLGERLGVFVRVELDEEIDVSGHVTENLLRITREAVTNAARHGHPRQITIRLERRDGVLLLVEDDGIGFDHERSSHSKGFGLVSMKERVAAIGGMLSVDSSPGEGTRVEVSLP